MKNVNNRNQKKKKMSKPLKIFIFTLLFAFIIAGVFSSTYFFMINKSAQSYEKNIKELLQKIDIENKKVSELIQDGKIDKVAAEKNLPKINDNLSAIKTTLLGEVPTDDYKDSHDNIINAIDNNILIYNEILTIIKSSSPENKEAALASLDKYEALTKEKYSLFKVKDLSISLTKETTSFIVTFKEQVAEEINSQKEAETKVNQNLDFAQKIDNIISNFIPLKTDFSQQLQKARSGSISFDDVLTFLEQYKENYLSLRKTFSSISTTDSSQKQVYYLFNNILDEYNLYLQEMKFSVSSEKIKLKEKNISEKDLTTIYSSATEKYNSIDANYNNFLKTFSEFKNKIK